MHDYREILFALIAALRDLQSWCPMCGSEKYHDNDCLLWGLWFNHEREVG